MAVLLLHDNELATAAEAAVQVFGVEEGGGEGAIEGDAGEGDEAPTADLALLFVDAHVGVDVIGVLQGDEFIGIGELEGGIEGAGVEAVEVKLVAELRGDVAEGVGSQGSAAGDGVVQDGELAVAGAVVVGVMEQALGHVGGVDGVLLALGFALAEVVVGVGCEGDDRDG